MDFGRRINKPYMANGDVGMQDSTLQGTEYKSVIDIKNGHVATKLFKSENKTTDMQGLGRLHTAPQKRRNKKIEIVSKSDTDAIRGSSTELVTHLHSVGCSIYLNLPQSLLCLPMWGQERSD